ncbi:hypothetical protein BDV96DRAFT_671576 [Lophiotrema nucula]|uniref:Uncharacterized protein n=1 Tax=Lophiotrema nucula TaxID=690887 RepID=A0A6A5ZLK1_9PLEO|nr:hypothetical protein BDV96DRAFT_671576 [Lophiotrema nucula]
MPISKPSLLQIFSVVLATGVSLAVAADCSGNYPQHSPDDSWIARQAYCGGGLWQTSSSFVANGVTIGNTNPGANNQQVCWDALENIISQCRLGGFGYGVYRYNGVSYYMFM